MATMAGGAGGAQETANKQLNQAMKALESGDNAAADRYMKEADKTISERSKDALRRSNKGFTSW
jgi:hypothetical protein